MILPIILVIICWLLVVGYWLLVVGWRRYIPRTNNRQPLTILPFPQSLCHAGKSDGMSVRVLCETNFCQKNGERAGNTAGRLFIFRSKNAGEIGGRILWGSALKFYLSSSDPAFIEKNGSANPHAGFFVPKKRF